MYANYTAVGPVFSHHCLCRKLIDVDSLYIRVLDNNHVTSLMSKHLTTSQAISWYST